MKTDTLSNLCTLIARGISPKYTEAKNSAVVLNQKCIRDHTISHTPAKLHDIDAKPVNPDKYLQDGDVLINSTGHGTLGRTAQVQGINQRITVDSHITIVRPDKTILYPPYFAYVMRMLESEFTALATGTSGQTELPRALLRNLKVTFVESQEDQRRIVKELDFALDKIDQAAKLVSINQMNARDIFLAELTKIFKKSQTWDEKLLSQVGVIERGKSKHRPRNDQSLYGGDYPFVQTGDIRNSKHVITNFRQTYNQKGLAQSKLWPKGTLCITIAANIAETAILGFDACFPDSIIGFIPHNGNVKFYEYLINYYKDVLQAKSKGSAQDNINLGTFQSTPFRIPDIKIQNEIVARLDAVDSLSEKLQVLYGRKLDALAELKQSFLGNAFKSAL
jgi:type I restriction enzyme S subunit